MPLFNYKALDSRGKQMAGTITADGRAAAMNQVLQLGLQPVTIEEEAPADGTHTRQAVKGRVSRTSVESFTRQLASLLTAGVPLSRALHILSREASQPAARQQWSAIHDDVVGGLSLGDALAKWPKTFPPVYVAMVRAGETGGFLEVVLGQIADFRSREQDLKGKVKAALVYPIVLATLASAVLVFLLTFFIPRFSTIFSEFGEQLPWLTRTIVGVSEKLVSHGVFVAAGIVVAIVVVRRVMASESGRRRMERLVLSLPAVGAVVSRFALVRFCRMLGTLLESGVPLISALRVAREAIGNQTLADTITRAVDDVQQGASLARSISSSNLLFPASVVEMVAVAEESGRLNDELIRIAGDYEGDLDRRMRMLVALAEPALLFVMAGIVGTVVIGMLLPVFTLQDMIR